MKKLHLITVILILSIQSHSTYAECSQEEGENILGTLVGAALGGLVGSQLGGGTGKKTAIGAGVLAGGYFGNKVSKAMNCTDHEKHYSTTQNALESQKTGETTTWVNPDTGNKGEVTPTRTFQSSDGIPRREFSQTIYIEGDYEQIDAKACRIKDGEWKIVS